MKPGRGKRGRSPKGSDQGSGPDQGPDLDPDWVGRVQQALRDWYDAGHRDLPWRRDRDPYRILVAETMLVQTTVRAVIPHFERFLERFPDLEALANAEDAEVLKAWEGLGYYRRARQLQAAARAIVQDHGGRVPDDPERLRALPGVGRYIAGAILSMAFDQPAPIVEANTQRVLARVLGWDKDLNAPGSQARLWRAAERLVPSQGAGAFNQAFMELGATVCTVRTPRCLTCPVSRECQARLQGRQDQLPVRGARRQPLEVVEQCALVARADHVLILQRGPGRLWEHFWEFPTIHRFGVDPAGRTEGLGPDVTLEEGIRRLSGINARVGPAVHTIRYSVTKHRVELQAHAAWALGGKARPGPGLSRVAWVAPEQLDQYPLSSANRRLADWLARHWPLDQNEG